MRWLILAIGAILTLTGIICCAGSEVAYGVICLLIGIPTFIYSLIELADWIRFRLLIKHEDKRKRV